MYDEEINEGISGGCNGNGGKIGGVGSKGGDGGLGFGENMVKSSSRRCIFWFSNLVLSCELCNMCKHKR